MLPDRRRPAFNKGLVYSVVNTATGRRYVGCTTSKTARERFSEHLSQLRRGIHCNPDLQADADAQGTSVFELEVLAFDVQDVGGLGIHHHEQQWIAHFMRDGGVYNRIIRGRPARFVTMRALAKALDVEPEALVDDDERRRRPAQAEGVDP